MGSIEWCRELFYTKPIKNFKYENVDGYSIQNTSKNFDSENVNEGRGELNHHYHFSFDASAIEDPCCSLIESQKL